MDDSELANLRRVTAETGAVASHATAAVLWGMRLHHPPPRPVVTVARDRSKVKRAGFEFRRGSLGPEDRWLLDGIAVTSRLRTVLDCARVLPIREGVIVADSALHASLIGGEQLRVAARSVKGPGAKRVQAVAALADGRSESVPETILRLMLLLRPALGPVEPQFTFPGRGHRYDLALLALCLVIEFQSWEFHGERRVWRRDARWGNEAYAEGWGYLQIVHEDLVAGIDHVMSLILGETHKRRPAGM